MGVLSGTLRPMAFKNVKKPLFSAVFRRFLWDGCVPLSIIHQKGIPLDGSNSCILFGYGAYGYSFTPKFDIRISAATRSVAMAFAHVRGGMEKGEAWYRDGYKTTKPNTWKDFISCAEY